MYPWLKEFYSGHILQTSFFSVLFIVLFIFRYVTCCAFSLDNKLLATGSNDKLVKIWKITADRNSKGEEKKQSRKPNSFCTAVLSWIKPLKLYWNDENNILYANDVVTRRKIRIYETSIQKRQEVSCVIPKQCKDLSPVQPHTAVVFL